jgi:hypothetical protein
VKFLRASRNRFLFHLGKRERALLLQTLELYPRIPPAHHRLSRKGGLPDQEANQRLLDEALNEQREENRRQLQTLLASPRRFTELGSGWRLSLSPVELEWLLQVLNDIRVGSWIDLGAPEEKIDTLTEQTAPHVWAMELAGFFQMRLLEALNEER